VGVELVPAGEGKPVATPQSNTFYISIKAFGWRRSWLLLFPFALVFVMLRPHYDVAAILIVVFTTWMGVWLFLMVILSAITVNSKGIQLYHVNPLPWSNIAAVDRRFLLGLPYLQITRANSAYKWWLPLYLQNDAAFYTSVIEFAPRGNALRDYAESVSVRPTIRGDGPDA